MGGKKAVKPTIEISPVQTRGAKRKDPDVVGQVTKQVTAEFATRFDRIERAIEAMAGLGQRDDSPPPKRKKPTPKTKEPQQLKKKPQQEISGASNDYDPVIFIEPATETITQLQQAKLLAERTPHTAQVPHHALLPEPKAQNVNKNWSTWLLDNVNMNPPRTMQSSLPLSVKEVVTDDQLESKVHNILTNTATRIAKGNAKTGQFPFQYVQRGPEKRHATMNTVTLPEHIWGIVCMIKDPQVQQSFKPALLDHIEQVCEDCRDYDWPSAVRRWSEEVFSLVVQNRLDKGWLAKQAKA